MPSAQFLAALATVAPATLAWGRNRHRTFSCSLEISLPPQLPFPLSSCSASLEATASSKQGLSVQAVCSLGLARNNPALGSHLAAGVTGFLSQESYRTWCAQSPTPTQVSGSQLLSSLQQFLMRCFSDLNLINLKWTFLGFPASHKVTGTLKLISC